MSAPNNGRHGAPQAFRFIGQSGRKVNASSHGTIRSHAMAEFRNRQRQQRQQEQSASAKKLDQCHCRHMVGSSSKVTENDSEKQLIYPSMTSSSSRCDRCGKMLSLTNSSLKLAASRQSAPPAAVLSGAGLFDFSSITELLPSIPSKFINEINAIKTHVVALSPTKMKSDILPIAFHMPGLLASILYLTYSHISSARGWGSPELALTLKAAAISHINQKMSHPNTATCTNVIAAVSYLCTGLWIFGTSVEEMEIHLHGIDLMVKQRGMDSLGVYQFGTSVRRQHHVLAAVRAHATTSTFDLDYTRFSRSNSKPSTKYASPFYSPGTCPSQLVRSRGLRKSTIGILRLAKTLTEAIIAFDVGLIEQTDLEILYRSTRVELRSHKACEYSGDMSSSDPILDCCRLTTLIILDAAETARPLMSTDPNLTLALVRALEKSDVEYSWAKLHGVLYWVCMVGSAAAQGRPGHGFLHSTLGRMMSDIAFTVLDFSYAIEPVWQLSRLQVALRRRSRFQAAENLNI